MHRLLSRVRGVKEHLRFDMLFDVVCYRLGIISDRIESGLKRLSRLSFLPHDLTIKEHMVRTSVFPCMFYGVECRPIATDQLQKVRTRTCDALLGSSRTSTPAFAFLLTSNGILDPAHWTLTRTVLAARRFLLLFPELQTEFLEIAVNFNGTLNGVKGPASSFAWVATTFLVLYSSGIPSCRHSYLHFLAYEQCF